MRRRQCLLVLLGLMLLVGCSPRPRPERLVIENEGMVCFYGRGPQTFDIRISTGDAACLSSSCTAINDRRGDMHIDADSFQIRLTSLFDVENLAGLGDRPCTADCAGAGYVDFKNVELKKGTYAVWLGSHWLGLISVPTREDSAQCFDTSRTPTPTPRPTPPPLRETPPPALFFSPLSPLATPTPDGS
ncbi:MAG: hypothetical protein D6775_01255 [Caldilineae bacterium]|nr:MAG: hypothetical protein D6775_01255 [Caldilineae bacterium]